MYGGCTYTSVWRVSAVCGRLAGVALFLDARPIMCDLKNHTAEEHQHPTFVTKRLNNRLPARLFSRQTVLFRVHWRDCVLILTVVLSSSVRALVSCTTPESHKKTTVAFLLGRNVLLTPRLRHCVQRFFNGRPQLHDVGSPHVARWNWLQILCQHCCHQRQHLWRHL